MNKITLEKINSSNGVYHVKLLIDGKDVGVLYLKEEEAQVLLNCLKFGRSESEVALDINIFDDEDEFEDDIDTD